MQCESKQRCEHCQPGLSGPTPHSCACLPRVAWPRENSSRRLLPIVRPSGGAARQPAVAIEYQRALAALYEQIGDEGASLECLCHAMHLEHQHGSIVDCDSSEQQSLTEAPRTESKAGALVCYGEGLAGELDTGP